MISDYEPSDGPSFQALLQEHYLDQVAPRKRTFLQSALAVLTGSAAAEAEQPRYGWWTSASDEEEEGSWGWRLAGAEEPSQAGNITDSLWFFFGRGEHGTVNIFGDDDCGVLVDKDNFERCVAKCCCRVSLLLLLKRPSPSTYKGLFILEMPSSLGRMTGGRMRSTAPCWRPRTDSS